MSSWVRAMTSISSRGDELLAQASVNLGRFVHSQAVASQVLLGFGWVPRSHAPHEFTALRRSFLRSSLTGRPLPVSDQHSAATIYGEASANYAFRFWHDVTHVLLERGFDLDAEIAVAVAHLDVLRAAGWGPGTLEYQLFHADTLGQTLCAATTGGFPDDQPCFGRRSVTTSLAQAIRAELAAHSLPEGAER